MAKRPVSSLDLVFTALVDPVRREILQRLEREGELTLTALSEPLGMGLPGTSKHLDALERAGLLARRRVGRTVLLRVQGEPLREAVEWLQHYDRFWSAGLDRLAAHVEAEEQPD